MSGKKIIFMGTPLIAADFFKTLIENSYKVVAVFTQPAKKQNRGMELQHSAVQNLANQNNIKTYTPIKLNEETYEIIDYYKPDLIIVMGYGLLIPKKILEYPKYGCINIHVSLLPRWRGASPIEHTLLNGDKETGVSIIKLIEKLDAGPILSQKKFNISENINKDDLTKILSKIGTELLIDFLPSFFDNNIKIIYQDEEKVTYANKINSKIRKINFNLSCKEIVNQIRAYSIKPGAWFRYNNERIKIISATIINKKSIPSTIMNDKFELGCLDGCIRPNYLQREGRKILGIEDFLRGFEFNVGDSLNV